MGAHHAVLAGTLCVVFAIARVSQADDDSNEARAQILFQRGLEDLAAGRVSAARDEFEESNRLDPAPGTMLALAACDERLGHLATAWNEFRRGARDARADGHEDWAEKADREAGRLEPTLPRLHVHYEGDSTAGLRVLLDGVPLPDSLNGPSFVDPGWRQLEISAAGKLPWEVTFEAKLGHLQEYDVRALGAVPSSPVPPKAVVSQGAAEVPPEGARSGSQEARRAAAVILGFAGIASAGVATGFFISAESTYRGSCTSICSSTQKAAQDSAWSKADVASAFAAVGAGALAGAVILWLWDPGGKSQVAIQPSIGVGLVGIRAKREW